MMSDLWDFRIGSEFHLRQKGRRKRKGQTFRKPTESRRSKRESLVIGRDFNLEKSNKC